MRCPKCGYTVPYKPNRKDTKCTLCGTPYKDDTDDILLRGKYQLVSEIRPAQAELARNIDKLITTTKAGTFFAEGGTGIGKSFAYLIPAILSKKRVVISTAKKTLQDQLVNTDLPHIAKKLRPDLKYGVYKGAANYACLFCAKSIKNKQERTKFHNWCYSRYTENEGYAEISTWPGSRPAWWDDVTIENCPKKNRYCEYRQMCRPHPQDWDIVVVNHAWLAVSFFRIPRMALEKILGSYNILIIDEAHQATDMFRSALTGSLTPEGAKRLWKRFANDDATHSELTHITSKDANTSFEQIYNKVKSLHEHLKTFIDPDTTYVRISQSSQLPTALLSDLSTKITKLNQALSANIGALEKSIEHRVHEERERAEAILGRLRRNIKTLERYAKIVIHLNELLSPEWLVVTDYRGVYIKPIDPGIWSRSAICNAAQHRILTSATMTIGSNQSFTHIQKELGLLPDPKFSQNTVQSTEVPVSVSVAEYPKAQIGQIEEAVYESPFNLHDQALLYTPPYLPLPAYAGTERREEWVQALAKEISRLLQTTQGDALVLFTARTDLEETYAAIQPEIPKHLPIFAQTENVDAMNVKQNFDRKKHSTIFGLKSFFEGIDIPKDKLRLVIITKLPFPNSKDPLIEALAERSSNAYVNVIQPRMLFDLKQAAGRLIRTQSDRGVLAILDPRIWTGKKKVEEHTRALKKIKNVRMLIRKNPKEKRRFQDLATYQGYGKLAVNTIGFTNRTPSFTKVEEFVKQVK